MRVLTGMLFPSPAQRGRKRSGTLDYPRQEQDAAPQRAAPAGLVSLHFFTASASSFLVFVLVVRGRSAHTHRSRVDLRQLRRSQLLVQRRELLLLKAIPLCQQIGNCFGELRNRSGSLGCGSYVSVLKHAQQRSKCAAHRAERLRRTGTWTAAASTG